MSHGMRVGIPLFLRVAAPPTPREDTASRKSELSLAGIARALGCGALVVLAGAVLVGATPAHAAGAKKSPAHHVYLMRGLFDVSTGLDDLAARIKSLGIAAEVASYTDQPELTARAIAGFERDGGCPVVLIGHSLGADAAIDMADALNQKGVPVALLVAFSPAHERSVPANVAAAVDYYQSNSLWNNAYTAGQGFRGTLRNVDLVADDGVHHFNIEKNAKLHEATVAAIETLRKAGCANRWQGTARPAAKSRLRNASGGG